MSPAGPEAIVLDATALEPPEPLQRATRILQGLQPGQYLHMQHRRLPYPLFDVCSQLQIEHCHRPGRECAWVILFWRSDDTGTGRHCRSLKA